MPTAWSLSRPFTPAGIAGRTTHIHFKVFLDETNILTGQMFFPDEISDEIHAGFEPYAARDQERDTLNSMMELPSRRGHVGHPHRWC